jgi:nucleoside-diphosphate-sugar epimerase
MARVMVTGAGGFIGRQAVSVLGAHGHDIIAVGGPRHSISFGPRVTCVSCDLMVDAAVSALVTEHRPTHLLHLAWTSAPGKFWTDPDNIDWMVASLRLFRVFARHGGRRFVGAGSCAEYDWSFERLSEAETPLKPRTLYGTIKAALGSTLVAASQTEDVSVAWGRVFFLYGPWEKPGRLVSDVFAALLEGRPALVSHGGQKRDFMHVADVAAALVAVLESSFAGPVNIASGTCRPLAELVHAIGVATGRGDLLRFGAVMPQGDEPLRLAADIHRLKDEIGFTPRFDLAAGVEDTYRWWQGEQRGTY